MIKRLICLAVTSSIMLLVGGVASAQGFFDGVKPCLGVLYKYQKAKAKGDWKGVLPEDFHNGGIFLGLNFPDNWGLELGYSESKKETDEKTFYAGDTIFEYPAIGVGQHTTLKTKIKFINLYLDLNGFMSLNDYWNLLGTIGIGWTKAKFNDNASSSSVPSVLTDTEMKNAAARARLIARFGFGTECRIKNFGIRAKLLWQNTNNLRLRDVSDNVHREYYRDSIGLAFGIYYQFVKEKND